MLMMDNDNNMISTCDYHQYNWRLTYIDNYIVWLKLPNTDISNEKMWQARENKSMLTSVSFEIHIFEIWLFNSVKQ